VKDLLLVFALLFLGILLLLVGALALVIAAVATLVVGVFLACCIVVIWAFEFIGLDNTRRRWGRLEFPAVTLEHEQTHKRVHLIGVMHIAQSDYWARIEQQVQSKNAVVLYESVSKPTSAEMAQFTPPEYACYEHMRLMQKTMGGEIAATLGLQFQREGLSYPSHWIRTDMSGVEFITRLAKIQEQFPDKIKSLDALKEEQRPFVRWAVRLALIHLPLITLLGRYLRERDEYTRATNELILDQRNVIGVQGILKHGGSADVVAIWGAAHLHGMLPLLEDAGYRQVEKKWFCAWKAEPYSFLQMVRDSKPES
jgi:hypothetical protein